MMIPIPKALELAYEESKLVGDYMLSPKEDWVQPTDFDRIDLNDFKRDFDGKSETEEGILCGAIRICNTGCEGYHIYVFSGCHAGELWSDQRIPFGLVFPLCCEVTVYLDNMRKFREKHIDLYQK